MATTTRGYVYPASTDHTRLWEHFQTLADDVDTDVGNVAAYTTTKPVGRIRQTAAQSGMVDSTVTAINFDAEDYDTGGYHSTSSNTSRITPTKAGYYRFKGVICWAGQTDYVGVDAFFRQNGTTQLPGATRAVPPASGTTFAMQTEVLYAMNGSTDYMELVGRHDRTGNATSGTTVSSFLASTLEWEWVRPL
jgi:hypothetical protein